MFSRRSLLIVVWIACSAVTPSPASAHSLDEVEGRLKSRETYMQFFDRSAPEFVLQDAHGQPVRLTDLRGRVVVLWFIYAGCPDFCPLHSDVLASVQGLVNQMPIQDLVQFVSVTTDPSNDTGEVLRGYGATHGLVPLNWKFLTSGPSLPEDTTRKIAERFGHKFTKTDEGYQIHSLVTHVIDREGRWRANVYGLKFEPTNLIQYINALAGDAHEGQVATDRAAASGPLIRAIAGAVGVALAVGYFLVYRQRRKRTG